MQDWLDHEVQRRLGSLSRLSAIDSSPSLRGIGYRLAEGAGILERRNVRDQLASLTKAERRKLSSEGVRIGRDNLFLPVLLKGAPHTWRMRLWWLFHGGEPPDVVRSPALQVDPAVDVKLYQLLGYTLVGRWAVRIDRWEAFAAAALRATAEGPMAVSPQLGTLAGVHIDDVPSLLRRLRLFPTGETDEEGQALFGRRGNQKRKSPNKLRPKAKGRDQRPVRKPPASATANPDSPFAGLRSALALAEARLGQQEAR